MPFHKNKSSGGIYRGGLTLSNVFLCIFLPCFLSVGTYFEGASKILWVNTPPPPPVEVLVISVFEYNTIIFKLPQLALEYLFNQTSGLNRR